MSRLLFPTAIALILAGVAFAHWHGAPQAPGTAPGSTRTPASRTSLDPGGDAGAPTAPVPQDGGGR